MSRTRKTILYARIPAAQKTWLDKKASKEDLPVSKIVARIFKDAMDAETKEK